MTPVDQLIPSPAFAHPNLVPFAFVHPNLIHGSWKVAIGLLKGCEGIQGLLDQQLGLRTAGEPVWKTAPSMSEMSIFKHGKRC